ncbi:MAG TPA: hypothetical protein VH560_11010 [Polyangia bacterium]|nr:hypothetical protein [Polyangia bacterium]
MLDSAAQAVARRVGVALDGAPAGHVRAAITQVLEHHGFEIVAPALGAGSDDEIVAAAKQAHLGAILVGEVKGAGKRLHLRVFDALGAIVAEGAWAEAGGPKKLAAAVERTLWARVGGALAKPDASGAGVADDAPTEAKSSAGEPESEATPTTEAPRKKKKPRATEADAPAQTQTDEETATGEPAGTALDISVGPRFVWRSLSWSGGMLTPYSMPHRPALGASIAWYPGAHVTTGWAANIGIAGALELMPGLTSVTNDGVSYPTTATDFWLGLRGRMRWSAVEGALTLGGGQQDFVFHGEGASNRLAINMLPDVKYSYFRAAIDLRIAATSALSIFVGGGVRAVLSAGDEDYLLQTSPYYLPSSKILGLEASAGVGLRVLPQLEARAGFDLRRYQISGGANTVGVSSGTDQFTSVWLGLAFLLDGVSGGEPTAAHGETKPTTRSTTKRAADEEPIDDAKPTKGDEISE